MRKTGWTDREPVDNPVVERIEGLLQVQGKTQKGLIEFVGLANGAFTNWKYNNGRSYMDHLGAICEYLDTSPNYLLYGKDGEINKDTLSPVELELIKNYRRLDIQKKELLVQMAKNL